MPSRLITIVDVILPPRCLLCGVIVARSGLCAACWMATHFIAPPLCACCGFPFPHGAPRSIAEPLCGRCAARRPVYRRARAAFRYDSTSRELLLRFKHGDHLETAPALGEWLARAGGSLLSGADFLVPVPLHWRRLLARRYNQAAILATVLARLTGIRLLPSALGRDRASRGQGLLNLIGRRRNVAGAFRLTKVARPIVEGANVVLVDDIYTTGASAEACSRALLEGGAGAVDVLTLGRAERLLPGPGQRLGPIAQANGQDAKTGELDYI